MTKTKPEPWVYSKWLTKTEAAKYIHRPLDVMTYLLESGEIPASVGDGKRGRYASAVVYVHMDDLDAFMRAHPYEPGTSSAPARRPGKPIEKDWRGIALSGKPITDLKRLEELSAKADEAIARGKARQAKKKASS